jgi:MFS family permease
MRPVATDSTAGVGDGSDTSTGNGSGSGLVLVTLGAGQFLMTLDSSVMNVSIATVAEDVGTTVTGIQTAITLYTLVMAMLMVSGGKVGGIIGRRRAFAIGCVVYGLGSLTTALAPNLLVLILGWSVLEGIGAALILPAIVALVAGNFPPVGRPRAYGLVMASGAVAIAIGPLLGGFATTYFSWRYVFAGEVVVVLVILLLARRVADAPPERRPRFDAIGAVLSALGLGLLVLGILRSGEWGWVRAREAGPALLGVSPVVWMIAGGLFVLWLWLGWQNRLVDQGREPLVQPAVLKTPQLRAGLLMFLYQYLVQMGLFFTIPLFLSVALGLSALETGARILPLSITLLVAAAGVPRFFPRANPRLVVRLGVLCLLLGILWLIAALDAQASASIVTVPLLLAGLGIGALSSQLGAVTVSSRPDSDAPEVGGLQNTATNLGASIGTALAGSILIAALSASLLSALESSPAVPDEVRSRAQVTLTAGVPFVSDAQLSEALAQAQVPTATADAVVAANVEARIVGLRTALFVLALVALVALFSSGGIPTRPPGSG